jgi:acyl carrier protein
MWWSIKTTTQLSKMNKPNSIGDGSSADLLVQSVEEGVYAAIDQLNQTVAPGQQLDKSRATILVDKGAQLDSMAVVNFLVFLEDEIATRFDLELDLIGADPFEPADLKTVGSVISAVCRRLEA